MNKEFPKVSNLDYEVNLLNHFKDARNEQTQQSPDESKSIADFEYNLYQRSDKRWHP